MRWRTPVASRPRPPRGRAHQDPITGELRRRDVLPLLVLHLIAQAPSYGNQLMERIAGMTAGVLSVNPNTMYPLLRELERRGPDRGQLGAPGAAHAPLLLAHRRRPRGVRPAGGGGAAVPRLRRAPASTRSCARCTASEDGGGPPGGAARAGRGAASCGRTRIAGPPSWRASGTPRRWTATGPSPAPGRSGSRPPGGAAG